MYEVTWYHLSEYCTKDVNLKGKGIEDLSDVVWMCAYVKMSFVYGLISRHH